MTGDIKITGLCKSFGQKKVFDNFSALIMAGRANCLLGPSGSGKTTLARLLLGLEKPDQGKIEGTRGLKFSVVFQEDRLCENLSAQSNVSFVSGKTREEASMILRELGLEDCEHQKALTLSGGQKRRAAIARALLADYDFLILDEPFKGLDEKTKVLVMDKVRRGIQGKTALLITHDRTEAEFLGCSNTLNLEAVKQS